MKICRHDEGFVGTFVCLLCGVSRPPEAYPFPPRASALSALASLAARNYQRVTRLADTPTAQLIDELHAGGTIDDEERDRLRASGAVDSERIVPENYTDAPRPSEDRPSCPCVCYRCIATECAECEYNHELRTRSTVYTPRRESRPPFGGSTLDNPSAVERDAALSVSTDKEKP